MIKITVPTTKFPPTTNDPKDSITWPAAPVPSLPCKRMIRVDATFRDNLINVTMSKSDGNTEKSKGPRMKTETNNIIKAKVILKERRRSNRNGGIGITITAKTITTPKPTKYSCGLLISDFSKEACCSMGTPFHSKF